MGYTPKEYWGLSDATLVILCYSYDSIHSFETMETMWIPAVEEAESKPVSILVGTKADLYDPSSPSCVKEEDAEELGKKYGLKDVLRCSAKLFGITNQMKGNVDQVFKSAVKHALIHRGLFNTSKSQCHCTLA